MRRAERTRLYLVLLTTVLAALLYAMVMVTLQPPPVASLTALVGALAAGWISSRAAVMGLMVGLVAGTVLHVYQHVSEGRVDVPDGLAGHIAADAFQGFLIAAVVLVLAASGTLLLARAWHAWHAWHGK